MIMEVFVVSAVRTAIGSFGGALRQSEPGELAALVTREALRRSALPAASIGHVVFGQVIPTAPRDAYLARVAALGAMQLTWMPSRAPSSASVCIRPTRAILAAE